MPPIFFAQAATGQLQSNFAIALEAEVGMLPYLKGI